MATINIGFERHGASQVGASPFPYPAPLAPPNDGSLQQGRGRILNVSSGAAHYVVPGFAAYAAMKGGIEVLTRYMAKELGERRIRVNVVAPGAIETDFSGGAVRDNAHVNKAVAGVIALGRAGLPDDVGKAVVAILSDDFGWVNGACVDISGGQNL